MPAVTTLAFYREQQTIDSFRSARPKSLQSLRAACRKEVEQLLRSLRLLELQYLRPHEVHEDFVRENLFAFRRVMMASGMREMRRAHDVEFAVEAVNSLGTESVKFVDSVQIMRAVQARVSEFLPDSFGHFSERLQKVLQCLQKYCLSFYRGGMQRRPDTLLDTPFRYEQERMDLAASLQKDIMALTEKYFIFGSVGLELSNLTLGVQQMARRCGCSEVALFLVFPEACERVREACRQVEDWLDKDKEYIENLGNDLVSMEAEKNRYQTQFQEEYTKMVQLKHKLYTVTKQVRAHEAQIEEFKKKKKQVGRRHHLALVELKQCEYHLHRAKTVLGEIKKHPENFHSEEEMKRAREESVIELKRQKTVFPRVWKKADFTESIVNSCKTKETEYEANKKLAMTMRFEIKKIGLILDSLQVKLDRIERYEKVIKHIHNLKLSPTSMKKVFHNLETDSRLHNSFARERSLSPQPLGQEILEYAVGDPILPACRVVAHFIDSDWHHLYQSLPFYPPRGQVDLDADVDRINKKLVRGSREELATEALAQWRRLHTRLNVDALRQALRGIGRLDVEQKMDNYLSRKMRPHIETRASLPAIAAGR